MIRAKFKSFLVISSLLLALVLAACGDSPTNTATSTTAAATSAAATTNAAPATTVASTSAAATTNAATSAAATSVAATTAATTSAVATSNSPFVNMNGVNITIPANLKAGPGVDAASKTIKIGVINPLSGPFAVAGKPALRGLETYFKALNEAGGIGGWKVEVVSGDSQYMPQLAVQQYNKLSGEVAMFSQILGAPLLDALKEQVTSDKILVGAVTFDSALIKEKYIWLAATPYPIEVINGMDYAVNQMGKKSAKFALIYQDDAYGLDSQKGYKAAVAAYGLTSVAELPFKVTDKEFTAQATQIKNQGAEVIILASQPAQTGTIMGTIAQLGATPQYILTSGAWNVALVNTPVKDLLAKTAIVTSKGVPWGDPATPGEAKKLAAVAKFASDQKADAAFSLGWSQGIITANTLGKALESGDLSREGMLKAFESLRNVDLGGSLPPASYGSTPDQRIPSRESTIFKIDPAIADGTVPLTKPFASEAARNYKLN